MKAIKSRGGADHPGSMAMNPEIWRYIVDAIDDSVFLHDKEYRLLLVNRAYCREAGVTEADALGKPYWEVFPLGAGPLPGCKQSHDILDDGGSQEEVVVGKKVFVSNGYRMRDDQGNFLYAMHVLNDITARKQAAAQLEKSAKRLRKSLVGTILAAAKAVEARDAYTAGHQQRVSGLSRNIAQKMGLDEEMIEGISMAASIHDIGKIYVPAEILSKPGKLSNNEFNLIRDHCQVGYDILKDIEFPWPVADIAYQHHERMDGSGYPLGLKGEAICLEARIVAVADVVEAMASHRPYRPTLGIEAALDEIRKKRATAYDPEVVDACLTLFAESRFVFTETG